MAGGTAKRHGAKCRLVDSPALDRGLARSSGPEVDAEGVADLPQGGFGAGGPAHVQRATVGAAERRDDAPLAAEDVAQGVPAAVDALLGALGEVNRSHPARVRRKESNRT